MVINGTLNHPFNCVVTGASGSGKSSLTANIIKYQDLLFNTKPDQVVWFYREGCDQELYHVLKEKGYVKKFVAVSGNSFKNIKDLILTFSRVNNKLFVFDDLMSFISEDTTELFTNIGHHHNCSNIFLTQSLYLKNENLRLMKKNTHYTFFCKSDLSKQDYVHVARELEPQNPKSVIKVFEQALKKKHSHLLFDSHPKSDPRIRFKQFNFDSQSGPIDIQTIWYDTHE